MLSFFCRARSAMKKSSLQDIEPNASTERLVNSSHPVEEKDLYGNHPTDRADNQNEFVWLRSHQVNRLNRANKINRGDGVNGSNGH